MLGKALDTGNGAAPLAARVALGAVIFPHGAQHGLGWFGGYGFSGGVMLGAASTDLDNSFFMNWFGTPPAGAEGYEYHILAGALAAAVRDASLT